MPVPKGGKATVGSFKLWLALDVTLTPKPPSGSGNAGYRRRVNDLIEIKMNDLLS